MEKLVIKSAATAKTKKGELYLKVKTDKGAFFVWDKVLFPAVTRNDNKEGYYVNAEVERGKFSKMTKVEVIEGEEKPVVEQAVEEKPTDKGSWSSKKSTYPTQDEKLELEKMRSEGQAKGNYRTCATQFLIATPKATNKDIMEFNKKLLFAERTYTEAGSMTQCPDEESRIVETDPTDAGKSPW